MKFIIFLLMSLNLNAQQNLKYTKLNWDFFKHGKPINGKFDALINTGFVYNYNIKTTYNDKINLIIKVSVKLDTNRSYCDVKLKYKDNDLLNHEQGHVNIASIYAEKLEDKIANTYFSRITYKTEVDALAQEINLIAIGKQKQYDIETNHGRNKTKQIEWDNYFKKELNIK